MAKAAIAFLLWALGVICACVYCFAVLDKYRPSLNSADKLRDIGGDRLSKEYEPIDCSLTTCSWLNYLSNEEFEGRYGHNSFLYEQAGENLELFIDKNDPPVKCLPESWGYKKEQADKIFPYIGYPTCSEKLDLSVQILSICPLTNTLTMNCSNGNGWYYLGNNQNDELLGYDVYEGSAFKYTGPVTLANKEEWAYGTCEEGKIKNLETATYMHRTKKDTIEHTKGKMEEMKKGKVRPLTVIMLTFDSLSRKHFYRKLPHTKDYLNSIDPLKFRVFDFKIHNVMGDNSLPNMYPIWTGNSMREVGSEKKHTNKKRVEDLIGEDAIWHYLKQRGWTTLFGTEFCDYYFAYTTGRKPDVDHLMAKFWCAAEKLSGYK